MIFKFPKKKIVLDCFTSNELILQTAPIVPAIKLIPDWWKELPKFYTFQSSLNISPTMKYCISMVDYYKKSVAIPMWSDLIIETQENGSFNWQFSDRKTSAGPHHEQQRTNFLSNHAHLKIHSPWFFKTKEDVKWVWSQPMYSLEEDSAGIKVLPGVIDFYNQMATNINLLIPCDKKQTYFYKQGRPLVQLTPMSDRKFEIVRHLISQDEFDNFIGAHSAITFLNKYFNVVNKRNQFADCPYHKGGSQ